jgi:hypothetical protein
MWTFALLAGHLFRDLNRLAALIAFEIDHVRP